MTKQTATTNALSTSRNQNRQFCINSHNSAFFPYKNHAYEVYKPKTLDLDYRSLKTIIADYEIMLSHYCRVLVCRIDLHPQTASADNQAISLFLKNLASTLSSKYRTKIIFHCAREQDCADKEHYHLELMLSGHRVQHSSKLLSIVKNMWKEQGTVAFVDKPYCIIRRGDKASIKAALYRSSYLAKEHTKKLNGKVKGFISNKLKPSARFDISTDLMLVDPHITFEQKRRKQFYKANPPATPSTNPKAATKTKYGWFVTLNHSQQLKECIASRTSSLSHLLDATELEHAMPLDHTYRGLQAPHEPRSGHIPI